MAEPATLAWLNRPDDARALLWHLAAPAARVLAVDEVGPHCALRIETPARLLLRTLTPPASSLTGDDVGLQRALRRLLGGAARPCVLAVGRIDRERRLRSMLGALDPDVMDLPAGLAAPAGFVRIEPPGGLPASQLLARPAIAGEVQAWLSLAAAPRQPAPAVHAAADLPATGFLPPRMEAGRLVRRTGRPRRCTLLLPGGRERVARVVLELAAPRRTLDRAALRIRLDGAEAAVGVDPATLQLTAEVPPAPPAFGHLLEIFRDADTEFSVATVALDPP